MLFGSLNHFICLFFPLLTYTATASPTFHIQVTEGQSSEPIDSVVFQPEGKQGIFLITDASGIGSAKISTTSGQWPKLVTLRFQYNKAKRFRTLEMLKISTSRFQVEGEIDATEKLHLNFRDGQGTVNADEPPAGYINVAIKADDDVLEVSLPPDLLLGEKNIEVAWIDAYRI